ncbi:MAG: C39 family peptidase [archaeon]|nr:C39 family peptidase [archaeon]
MEGYIGIIEQAMADNLIVALVVLVMGIAAAKAAATLLEGINNKLKLISPSSLRSLARLLELLIFVIFTIIALGVLEVAFAQDVLIRVWGMLPNVLIILLLLLLGYIIINLMVDILRGFFVRLGQEEYFSEFGVTQNMVNTVFIIIKVFLYLVLVSITLNYYAKPVPFFDTIIAGTVFTIMFFLAALVAYSFKDYVSNALLAKYVEKNVLKPGQRIKIGDVEGEVISITSHGATIEMNSGYNHVIPNKNLMTKEIQVKRIRSNITQIEYLMKNFEPQLPSFCGPASAKMMLEFFGYNIRQEDLATEAKTRVPGGTDPDNLILAVKKFTNAGVRGQLIRFDEIFDLAEEAKAWIAEGALIILWYKKPVLFPTKQSKSGHYVLCVGVEGEELIVMDPSEQTAGVYLVNHRLLEDAMDEYDISRGYIVFAQKGTSAFWRLNEGLIYGDVSSYKNLSKSFERYLKRQFRQRNMLNEIISEHLLPKIKEDKAKHVWRPDLTTSRQKQKLDKSASIDQKVNGQKPDAKMPSRFSEKEKDAKEKSGKGK